MNELELYHPYGFWYSDFYLNRIIIAKSVMGVLGLILMLFFVYRWLRKRRLKKAQPWYIVLNKLESLRPEAYRGEHKKFYSILSELVRNYCSQRFMVPPLSTSDTLLIKMLRTLPDCSAEAVGCLEQAWHSVVLIKFADQSAELEHMEKLRQSVRFFVQESIPLDTSGMLRRLNSK